MPWIKTGELQDNVIVESEETLSAEGIAKSSAKLLPRGTILMAMYGATVGALARLGREATCNQASCAMIADPARADERWLYYSLLNDRARIVSRATGAAQQNLSAATIKGFTYTTPPLSEQQAIAEVLGALDDKIAANTALAAAAERLAITEISRLPGRVALSRLITLSKHQLSATEFHNEEVEHFSLPAFDADKLPARENGADIRSSKFAVTDAVVLLSKLNPRFPRVWRAHPRAGVKSVASTEFLVLHPIAISPAMLWAVLAQPTFSAELDTRAAGTSGSHQRVRPDDVLRVEVADPRTASATTRGLIDAALAAADLHRAENRTLAATRDALLPQLMSGKLRVRDAEVAASEAGA
ncbi:hypothetical protein A8L33_07920 [Microbacterium aurantiacum]|nr:hypothetical protein A8L33_07920 [Microbacterium chocolatum]